MVRYALGMIVLLLFIIPVWAVDYPYQKILDAVKAGDLQLAIVVDEETMPTLPETLTEEEIIQWIANGWVISEEQPDPPDELPLQGDCRAVWRWCGFPDYCIICSHNSGGDRNCNCMDAFGEPDF